MSAIFSKRAVNTSSAGLRKRPTYEELIKYIEEDPDTIRYPNRNATIMSNTFEFNQMVGEGFRQMQQMSNRVTQQRAQESLFAEYASTHGLERGKLMELATQYGLAPVRSGMGNDKNILK